MKSIFLPFLILLIFFSCQKENTKVQTDLKKHKIPNKSDIINKIAFSSGCNQFKNQGFWDKIKEKEPDLWISGGDNIYSDTEDRNVLKRNYLLLKENKFYQSFISEIPVIGVWDDHDYGGQDVGETYPIKNESKEEFMNFFDIPNNSDIRKHNGIYQSYLFGNGNKTIKIYLLDNRFFKTDLVKDENSPNYYLEDTLGTVLGEEQWTWLENEIYSSNAAINIFVSGLQIIPNNHIYEKWGNFPLERQRFLDLINNSSLNYPIILSGDRHYAEFSKYELNNGKNIYEFTASGMTHSFEGVNEQNDFRIGDFYDGKNFGELDIKWETVPKITLNIYNISGGLESSIDL